MRRIPVDAAFETRKGEEALLASAGLDDASEARRLALQAVRHVMNDTNLVNQIITKAIADVVEKVTRGS